MGRAKRTEELVLHYKRLAIPIPCLLSLIGVAVGLHDLKNAHVPPSNPVLRVLNYAQMQVSHYSRDEYGLGAPACLIARGSGLVFDTEARECVTGRFCESCRSADVRAYKMCFLDNNGFR